MYDHSGNALKVYGTYKLENSKVCITYMKDQYGNEAPYDFYNLRYTSKYTFGTNSINSNIQNNRPLSNEMWQAVFKNLPLYLKELGITEEQFYIIRYIVSKFNPSDLDKDLYKIYEKNKPLFTSKFRKITSKRELQKIIVDTIKEE